MTVREIGVDELHRLGPTAIQLIDVREPDEYAEARVPGAKLVPLATVPDTVADLDREQPVYLICAVGGRSLQAAEWLAMQGFETVNIAGGTKGWMAAGMAVDTGPSPS